MKDTSYTVSLKAFFNIHTSNLYQFSSDSKYREFCLRTNLQYESQAWFKLIYVEDSLEKALSYILQQSIIFQDLYFPSDSNKIIPSLHDVEICHKSYNFTDTGGFFAKVSDLMSDICEEALDSTKIIGKVGYDGSPLVDK